MNSRRILSHERETNQYVPKNNDNQTYKVKLKQEQTLRTLQISIGWLYVVTSVIPLALIGILPIGIIRIGKIPLRGVIIKIQPLKEPVNFQQYDLCTNFKSTPEGHVKSPTF